MKYHIPKNLRINADDFGLSPSINRAILEAAQEGCINSVSVVPFTDLESKSLFNKLLQLPNLRIGAHLTFIEISLLTKPKTFPKNRPPKNYRDFLKEFVLGRIHASDVVAEWRAQIQLLQERLGPERSISHLDGHQHLQVFPVLSKQMLSLQTEFNISLVRIPYENSWWAYIKDFPFGLVLQFFSLPLRHYSNEVFFGVGTSMSFRSQTYLKKAQMICAMPQTQFELMVHLDEDTRGRRELQELKIWMSHLTSNANGKQE